MPWHPSVVCCFHSFFWEPPSCPGQQRWTEFTIPGPQIKQRFEVNISILYRRLFRQSCPSAILKFANVFNRIAKHFPFVLNILPEFTPRLTIEFLHFNNILVHKILWEIPEKVLNCHNIKKIPSFFYKKICFLIAFDSYFMSIVYVNIFT